MVLRKHTGTLRGGEEEIATLAQTDVRRLAIDREMPPDLAQEGDAVERDADVHRGGKLLPDRCRRERGGAEAVGGIFLQHQHPPAECRIRSQMEGHRGARCRAADDEDVGLHQSGTDIHNTAAPLNHSSLPTVR